MDYEKKYNEALERAKKLSVDGYLDAIAVEEIFPPEESEDERIRKELINFLRSPFIKENLTDEKVAPWLEWLEKQKEQEPISSCDIVPYIDDKIAALQDMWREEKVSFDWDDMKDMIEDVARHFYQQEQKPAWSEEDESMRWNIISVIGQSNCVQADDMIDWLKSLRPSWKPSDQDELMKLKYAGTSTKLD